MVSAGAVALGVALEYVQRFTGWRDFEYGDMIASAAGVLGGVAAGMILRAVVRWSLPEDKLQVELTCDRLVTKATGLKLP